MAFAVSKNDEGEYFNLDDWVESLAERRNGVYVKNAKVFIVAHVGEFDELATMRNVRARVRTVSMLREYYPDLPQDIKGLSNHTCVYMDDGLASSIQLKELEAHLKFDNLKKGKNTHE